MIILQADTQVLKACCIEPIVSDSLNAIDIKFLFSDDWDGFTKTAQFTQVNEKEEKATTYNVLLDETCVALLPNEITSGVVLISVFGVKGEQRLTTAPLAYPVIKSGFTTDGQTPIPPTPDLYQQIIERVESAVASAPSVKVEETETGAIITAIDADGETTATLKNGELVKIKYANASHYYDGGKPNVIVGVEEANDGIVLDFMFGNLQGPQGPKGDPASAPNLYITRVDGGVKIETVSDTGLISTAVVLDGKDGAAIDDENASTETTYSGAKIEGGFIKKGVATVARENIADLAINGAKINYNAITNAKITAGTIQKDRLSAEALAYLTGGPYMSISGDGTSRMNITQGRHLFALRLITNDSKNLNTWLLNHSTFDGVYLHQGTDIEAPLKLAGRGDFVGGIHGNERLVSVRMIADAVDITGNAVELSGVKTLSVYVTSTVYDTDGTTALFDREKVLTFADNSLIVENRWTYTGAESVNVERWPGSGLYSTYTDNTLGCTTNKALIPSLSAQDWNAGINEAAFWVSGTKVTLKALRSMNGDEYAGCIEKLDGSARIKAYFDTIHAPGGYALNAGDVLEGAYQITIGG